MNVKKGHLYFAQNNKKNAMVLIKLFFGILWLMLLVMFWPVALVIAIFLGLMKVGMKKDFEP